MAKFQSRVVSGSGEPLSFLHRFLFGFLWPVGWILGSGVFVAFGATAIVGGIASKRWASTEGVITYSVVDSGWHQGAQRSGAGAPPQSGVRHHRAVIEYVYTVDGREYTGDRVEFGEFFSSNASRAHRHSRRFREGREVEIFYDPKRPERSVLIPGRSTWFAKVSLCGGLGFMTVGVLVGLLIRASIRQRQRQRRVMA